MIECVTTYLKMLFQEQVNHVRGLIRIEKKKHLAEIQTIALNSFYTEKIIVDLNNKESSSNEKYDFSNIKTFGMP